MSSSQTKWQQQPGLETIERAARQALDAFDEHVKQEDAKRTLATSLTLRLASVKDVLAMPTFARVHTLDASNATHLNDAGLGALVSKLPALQHVDFSGCLQCTPAAMNEFVRAMGSRLLTYVYNMDCVSNHPAMSTINAHAAAPNLEELSLTLGHCGYSVVAWGSPRFIERGGVNP